MFFMANLMFRVDIVIVAIIRFIIAIIIKK